MSDSLKPAELVKMGLMDELSIHDYQVDQRVVDEALGLENDPLPQHQGAPQGGVGDATRSMRNNSSEFGRNGSAVPFGKRS